MYTDRLKGQYYTNYLDSLAIKNSVDLQLERLQKLFDILTTSETDEFNYITEQRQSLLDKLHLLEIKVQYIKNSLDNYQDRFQILIDERYLNILNNIDSILSDIENKYDFNIFNVHRPSGENSLTDVQRDMLRYNSVNPIGIRWFGGKVSNTEFMTDLQHMYAHIIKIDNSKYDRITNFIGSNPIIELFIFSPTMGFTWVVYSKTGNYDSNFYIKYKSDNTTEFKMLTFNETFNKVSNFDNENIFSINMLLQLQNDMNENNSDTYIKIKTNLPAMSLNGVQNILLGLFDYTDTNDINDTNLLKNITSSLYTQMVIDDPEINSFDSPAVYSPFIVNKKILVDKNVSNVEDRIKNFKYIGNRYIFSIVGNNNMLNKETYFINNYSSYEQYTNKEIEYKINEAIYFKYSDLSKTVELPYNYFRTLYMDSKKNKKTESILFSERFPNYMKSVNELLGSDDPYSVELSNIKIPDRIDYANYIHGEYILDFSNLTISDIHKYVGLNNSNLICNKPVENTYNVYHGMDYRQPIDNQYENIKDTIPTGMSLNMKSYEHDLVYTVGELPYNNPISLEVQEQYDREIDGLFITNNSLMKPITMIDNPIFSNSTGYFPIEEFFTYCPVFDKIMNNCHIVSEKYGIEIFINPPTSYNNNPMFGRIEKISGESKMMYYYTETRYTLSGDQLRYFGHPEIASEPNWQDRYSRHLNRSYGNLIKDRNGEIYCVQHAGLMDSNTGNEQYIDTIVLQLYYNMETGEIWFEEKFFIPGETNVSGEVYKRDRISYNFFYENHLFINIFGFDLGTDTKYILSEPCVIFNVYSNEPEIINTTQMYNISSFSRESFGVMDYSKDGILVPIITGFPSGVRKVNFNVPSIEDITSEIIIEVGNGTGNFGFVGKQFDIITSDDRHFINANGYVYELINGKTVIEFPINYPAEIAPTWTSYESTSLYRLFEHDGTLYLLYNNEPNSIICKHLFMFDNKEFIYKGEIQSDSIYNIVSTKLGTFAITKIDGNLPKFQFFDLDTLELKEMYQSDFSTMTSDLQSATMLTNIGINEYNNSLKCLMVSDNDLIIPCVLQKENLQLNQIVKTKYTERI